MQSRPIANSMLNLYETWTYIYDRNALFYQFLASPGSRTCPEGGAGVAKGLHCWMEEVFHTKQLSAIAFSTARNWNSGKYIYLLCPIFIHRHLKMLSINPFPITYQNKSTILSGDRCSSSGDRNSTTNSTSGGGTTGSSSQKKCSPDESIVRKLMLDSWNQSIFINIKHRLQDSAMKLVHAERNGDAFDSQLVIGVRESYVNLCSNSDDKLLIYRENFEAAYLQASSAFYRLKASEQLQANGMEWRILIEFQCFYFAHLSYIRSILVSEFDV